MKKLIAIFFLMTLTAIPAYAMWGNYGDLMLLYAPDPTTNEEGARIEREFRSYEEALLHLQIPSQYTAGGSVRDEALICGDFSYHTEICGTPHEYTELWGMNWKRYGFTEFALQKLDIEQVVAVHEWIVIENQEKYKIPLEETHNLYLRYIQGEFGLESVPIELMIGTEYGQTIDGYTDFGDFDEFMNKHHYCIPATYWSVLKSLYDKGSPVYRAEVEAVLSNPRIVQSLDTLTAGRLIGMLLRFELIEEY